MMGRVCAIALACASLTLACSRDSRSPQVTERATQARYLALGDSFTIGQGSEPSRSFPSRLVARWRDRGCDAVLENLGVTGYTTQNLIDRELPEVAGFAPSFVTLAIGANDIVHEEAPEKYRANVRLILSSVIAAGVRGASIACVSQPDWSRAPAARAFGEPVDIAHAIESSNEILRAECAAVGARYVDLYALSQREADAKMVSSDGLHPSAAAYDEWSAALAEELPPPCAL
jgi:lysophospholipase L1-like esterase